MRAVLPIRSTGSDSGDTQGRDGRVRRGRVRIRADRFRQNLHAGTYTAPIGANPQYCVDVHSAHSTQAGDSVNPGLIPLSVSEIFQYIQQVGRFRVCRIFCSRCAYADYAACRTRVPPAHLVYGDLQRNAAGPFEPGDGGPHPPGQVRACSLRARRLQCPRTD